MTLTVHEGGLGDGVGDGLDEGVGEMLGVEPGEGVAVADKYAHVAIRNALPTKSPKTNLPVESVPRPRISKPAASPSTSVRTLARAASRRRSAAVSPISTPPAPSLAMAIAAANEALDAMSSMMAGAIVESPAIVVT